MPSLQIGFPLWLNMEPFEKKMAGDFVLSSKDSRPPFVSPHNFGELVLTPVVTIGDPMLASLVLARVHHDDGGASDSGVRLMW